MLHLFLSFIAIFMLSVLLILLTACLPSSCGLAAQGLFLPLTPILSNYLMQELTSTPNHTYFFLELPACFCISTFLRLDLLKVEGFKTFVPEFE
ncbi:hypothetical protein E2C01_017929 [Portunus trituberculatus]|uniref:Uncharacterized protein n=1 Tax=Portunus trituberculatus TaxID=210409 RepID=A0A5B7DU55_PORTR|nr:hypothetical protein [Portunus trituberculatus]